MTIMIVVFKCNNNIVIFIKYHIFKEIIGVNWVLNPCFGFYNNKTCNFHRNLINNMPALDINLVQQLGRDLHSVSPGYMGEDEVCPWTLFLTMALTLLKGR